MEYIPDKEEKQSAAAPAPCGRIDFSATVRNSRRVQPLPFLGRHGRMCLQHRRDGEDSGKTAQSATPRG